MKYRIINSSGCDLGLCDEEEILRNIKNGVMEVGDTIEVVDDTTEEEED